VHFVKELKQDELAESARWSQQAKAVQGNVFRWLAQTRDTAAVSAPAAAPALLARAAWCALDWRPQAAATLPDSQPGWGGWADRWLD